MFGELVSLDFPATRAFQEVEMMVIKLLSPGSKIDDSDLTALGIPTILMIGNSCLNTTCFKLRPVDCLPVGNCMLPGKSVTLDYWGVTDRDTPLSVKDELVRRSFGKSADRRDYIYYSTLASLDYAGYSLYYAPESTNGLHCRLVWRKNEQGVAELPDEDVLTRLVNAWTKVQISK